MTMNKYKVLALMGESGSGKSTISDMLCQLYPKDFKRVITCTTRPPRDYEKDGIDYHFLTSDEFARKVLDGSMLEAQIFNDWHYGTPINSLSENVINIAILTPEGVRIFQEYSNIDLLTIHLIAPAKNRIVRMLDREAEPNIDEIFRRYNADLKDFSEANLADINIAARPYNIHLPESTCIIINNTIRREKVNWWKNSTEIICKI